MTPGPACRCSEDVDRHGVRAAGHCGGPGDTSSPRVGFHITARDEPIIVFRCLLGRFPSAPATRAGRAGP